MRLSTKAVRDGQSLGWIVDALEYIYIGERLAADLVNSDFDGLVQTPPHPIRHELLDQLVRFGEPSKIYAGSADQVEFMFIDAEEVKSLNVKNHGQVIQPELRDNALDVTAAHPAA